MNHIEEIIELIGKAHYGVEHWARIREGTYSLVSRESSMWIDEVAQEIFSALFKGDEKGLATDEDVATWMKANGIEVGFLGDYYRQAQQLLTSQAFISKGLLS